MQSLRALEAWIGTTTLWWAFVVSLLLFLVSVVMIPLIISRMRADYFVREPVQPNSRAMRWLVIGARNLLGYALILAGMAMLVLPGQGILTILVGISLADFRGKRRIQLMIVRQRHVRQWINWLRKRSGQPALILPEPPPRKPKRRRFGSPKKRGT